MIFFLQVVFCVVPSPYPLPPPPSPLTSSDDLPCSRVFKIPRYLYRNTVQRISRTVSFQRLHLRSVTFELLSFNISSTNWKVRTTRVKQDLTLQLIRTHRTLLYISVSSNMNPVNTDTHFFNWRTLQVKKMQCHN